MIHYIAYFATIASVIGTVANSFKKRWCFVIWLCTNAFWCIYNLSTGQTAQAILYAFNFAMAIIGILKWGEGEKRHCNNKGHTKIALSEADRAEFEKEVSRANVADILEIIEFLEKTGYARIPEKDAEFCKAHISRRCGELMKHKEKYGCFPE